VDIVDYQIHGDDIQIVEIGLDPGEGVRAEVGAMIYMDAGIKMQTSTGGLIKGLKRVIAGESFFITTFSYDEELAGKGYVAFGAPYPGKIIPLHLGELGGSFLCQKDSFLCAAHGIEIDVAFTRRIGAGLFGGEGFILQRLTGDGLAFIYAGGTIIRRPLIADKTLRIDPGCVVAFSETVDFDIEFVGGFRNALFGGEGVFLAKVTGPGVVYLQSLPLSRLSDRIVAASRLSRQLVAQQKSLQQTMAGIQTELSSR